MEILEKHFDTAFAAPDGIKKLRELILTLAMQGKLVPQDPNDTPASTLIKEIEAEKHRLIKEKKIKKAKPLPEIKPEDVPYEVPDGWKWVRFGEILTLEYGDNLPARKRSNTGEFPVYGSNGIVGTHNIPFVKDPCIIVGRKGSAGALNLSESAGCCVTDVSYYCIPPKGIDLKFLFLLFHTLGFESLSKGIKPGLNRNEAYVCPMIVAPILEQHRIVARIEQLMARCDELEKLRAERDSKRLEVHTAALAKLLDTQDQDASTSAQQFLTQHFGELYTVKENVAELRKAILQLAVMGKLVPQDPNDEPASELLKEIEAEKTRLIKEKKIKKAKPLPEIKPEEVPYELPDGWEWVRLGELGYILGGGTPSKSKHQYWIGSIPWVSPKDMKFDYISNSQDHISEEALLKSTVKLIPEHALLIVVRGMILAHSFPTALTNTVVTINQDLKALCLYKKEIRSFLLAFTKGMRQIFLNLVERSTHGTCRLATEKLFSVIVGIPPLIEQQRIVTKIDQLMTICDTLEQQIDKATAKQTELLDAVMAQV